MAAAAAAAVTGALSTAAVAATSALSASEVRGSGRECQAAMVQERPRRATQVPGQGRWPRGLSHVLLREGNGTPLQHSCLENPMDGEAWWAAVGHD